MAPCTTGAAKQYQPPLGLVGSLARMRDYIRRSVEVREDLLNYQILIQTGSDMIRFTTQQKELSEFRTSGALSGAMNWHRKNLDATLKSLREMPGRRTA